MDIKLDVSCTTLWRSETFEAMVKLRVFSTKLASTAIATNGNNVQDEASWLDDGRLESKEP